MSDKRERAEFAMGAADAAKPMVVGDVGVRSMMESEGSTTSNEESTAAGWSSATIGALAVILSVAGLFFYKWSAALRTLHDVRATGVLHKSSTVLTDGGTLASTIRYFGMVGPALLLGITIGAAVRAGISERWVRKLIGGAGARSIATAGLIGAPLMLCSCCVTPVTTGLRERGARLGPALALMMSSPGLNPAALTLTFLLFPLRIGALRLVAAALLVFGLSTLIDRFASDRRLTEPQAELVEPPGDLGGFSRQFLRSFARLALLTLPLIAVGVLASAMLVPHAASLGANGGIVTTAVVAVIAALFALPTFLEIPLALILLQLGAPGAALAMLVAGPIVNLPSLLVVGREAGPRVAIGLALGVVSVAFVAGLGAG